MHLELVNVMTSSTKEDVTVVIVVDILMEVMAKKVLMVGVVNVGITNMGIVPLVKIVNFSTKIMAVGMEMEYV